MRVRGATKDDENPWLNHVLEIYALFMFLGIFTTLCIPETARITLEVLSGEDQGGHITTPVSRDGEPVEGKKPI